MGDGRGGGGPPLLVKGVAVTTTLKCWLCGDSEEVPQSAKTTNWRKFRIAEMQVLDRIALRECICEELLLCPACVLKLTLFGKP